MPMQTLTSSQASPEVPINENFISVDPAGLHGIRQPATTGLTWGFYGGQYSGNTVANGTVALTASTTNYVVALRSTGAVSTSTATTNWNDTVLYQRLYSVVTGASSITSYTDYRQAYGHASINTINKFSKNQSVSPSVLTSGASIAVDASLSNNFRLVLATAATLSNPTNLTDGMVLTFRIKQDATGGRTLSYGTAYKFPGNTPPTLSPGANAVDLIQCYYDSTDANLACVIFKSFTNVLFEASLSGTAAASGTLT